MGGHLSEAHASRRLYEIDSYEWLSRFPKHWDPIQIRLKLLFEDLFHGGPEEFFDSASWGRRAFPKANGYKTVLSIYWLLKEKYIQDPITISFFQSNRESIHRDDNILVEPGKLRVDMLPYLPRQKIRIVTFNLYKYLPEEYEIPFETLDPSMYETKEIAHRDRDRNPTGIYKIDDNLNYYDKCRAENIVFNYNKDGMFVNHKLLIKRVPGAEYEHQLIVPNIYTGEDID